MNRRFFLHTLAAGAAAGLAALALPAEAQGRGRGRGRNDDDRDRDRDRGRGDRPRVQALIRQLENDTDALRRRIETLTRGDRREGERARRLRERIRELESAANALRAEVDSRRSFDRRVSRREADVLLRAGNRVQEIIQNEERWRNRLGSDWSRVRRHLNDLARIFDLPTLSDRD